LISPLAALLEKGVDAGQTVKDPTGTVYTGFADFHDLATSNCEFSPMNSNRAINQDVVRARTMENVLHFDKTGRYLEFGQIVLLILGQEDSREFLVMDGQHRCETMRALHRQYPNREIYFQYRAKVVQSEAQAYEELQHFQRSYPSDPRSFFRSRAAARCATAVVTKLKADHPTAVREMLLSDKHGRRTGDPARPFLNDNIIFWLLTDAGLLDGIDGGAAGAPANAVDILAALSRMNNLLSTLPAAELGKSVTKNMRDTAEKLKCFLGFFRDSEVGLRWAQVEQRLAAAVHLATPEPAAKHECVVCLDAAVTMAFVPCGHRCVCEPCAAAVRAAPGRACVVCRRSITDSVRIFDSAGRG